MPFFGASISADANDSQKWPSRSPAIEQKLVNEIGQHACNGDDKSSFRAQKLHGFDTVERIFVRAKNRSNLKNRNHFTLTSLVGELMQIHLKVGKDYKRYTTM